MFLEKQMLRNYHVLDYLGTRFLKQQRGTKNGAHHKPRSKWLLECSVWVSPDMCYLLESRTPSLIATAQINYGALQKHFKNIIYFPKQVTVGKVKWHNLKIEEHNLESTRLPIKAHS